MKAYVADITSLAVDVIVNAANGQGPMGAGVAGVIAKAAGYDFRAEVMEICKKANGYKDGDCYISSPGDLGKSGVKAVFHAVTMTYPGGRTSLDIVEKAMRSTFIHAIKHGMKSIAFPGLGTGIGGLDHDSVATVMVKVAKDYDSQISIHIVDIDTRFVNSVNRVIEEIDHGRLT